MGLCKCPKRRVTNQFCFEHRVNVCEHCMVQKHPNVSPEKSRQKLKISRPKFEEFKITKNPIFEKHVLKNSIFSSAWFKVTYSGYKTVIIIQT